MRSWIVFLLILFAAVGGCSCKGGSGLPGAAARGDFEEVKRLVESGADINEQDWEYGETALCMAVGAGNYSVAKYLVEAGADVNLGCPLWYATRGDRIELLTLLLEKGANPNEYRLGKVPSPVCEAAFYGEAEVMKLLIRYGADVKTEDAENGPMLTAAARGKTEIVQILGENGVNLNTRDWGGKTPLMLAIEEGQYDTALALLKLGADVAARDKDGLTAMDYARRSGDPKMVEALGGR